MSAVVKKDFMVWSKSILEQFKIIEELRIL